MVDRKVGKNIPNVSLLITTYNSRGGITDKNSCSNHALYDLELKSRLNIEQGNLLINYIVGKVWKAWDCP